VHALSEEAFDAEWKAKEREHAERKGAPESSGAQGLSECEECEE
tara:strand:+ start:272 stop:403 length:132 start_codon:yes stop_codon:yes gene_type:complete